MVIQAAALGPSGRPYTVSEITRVFRRAIEGALPRAVAVEGEITNFSRHPGSGHMYFALRDAGGILRCVMFRTATPLLRFDLHDGIKVEAQGLITFYGAQGQIQLQVDALAPAGRGALLAALEDRKQRLAREGLFAEARKRALPRFPQTVGLVTSPSGAALRDLIELLRRRAPSVRIVLAPARVQGEGAASSLAAAIDLQNRWGGAEVLIVGRGGGAVEDLWAFNEENVVRAIAGSRIPVVSAVGHEVDITLADLAADRRASTPSHAAEMVVPDMGAVWRELVSTGRRLERRVTWRLANARRSLAGWPRSYAFRRPAIELRESAQRLDELSTALARALGQRVERARRDLALTSSRLPGALRLRREDAGQRIERSAERLVRAGRAAIPERSAWLKGLQGQLEALGPGQVLRRGYALVRRVSGEVVTEVSSLAPLERLRLDLHDGHLVAEVTGVVPGETIAGSPAEMEQTS